MNRRSLLAMLGLAPVASCAPMPALADRRFATGGWVKGKSYALGQAAILTTPPLQGEVLRVQVDEGMISRAIRTELAKHGLHTDAGHLGFTDGAGI